ncbi:MAG: HpcH/HpaI aldolase/citrate lyase family protein [Devosia sp.]
MAPMTGLSTGVAFLFVPATRLDRVPKALLTNAAAVIIDLEDAVAPGSKADAREALRQLQAMNVDPDRLIVRINASGTQWFEDDLAAAAALPVSAVMLPKTENLDALRHVASVAGPKLAICALIETAIGLEAATVIAQSGLVQRLAFGSLDFAADIGCAVSDLALIYARSRLVLASRLGNLAAPLDGVTADFEDAAMNLAEARHALDLGFGGKLCIHPRQIEWVHCAIRPSDEELTWARTILAAGENATAIGGSMVDAPVKKRAQQVLYRHALSSVKR